MRDLPFGNALDDLGRLVEMVLAAEDFGLRREEACAVANAALIPSGEAAGSVDDVAAALAERVLANTRRDLRAAG